MFNIIDHKSGYKADFIILKNEPYRITEFERRRLIDFMDMKIYVVSPEDLLLSKIIWVQQSESSLQFEDIRLLSKLENLVSHFKEGYYCDEDAVKDAIHRKSMFNIIDHKSGYKADFIILKNEPYRITEFERRRLIDFMDMKIYVVSPEDLLLSKIIWVQQSESSLQFEDIRLLSKLENLDRQYVSMWIDTLKLNTFNLINND